MKLYNYTDSGLYVSTTTAKESPLEPGIYRTPKNATTTKPPQTVLDGTTSGYWLGGSWSSVAWPEDTEIEVTIEVLISEIISKIDETTANIIKAGFYTNGQQVRLTVEDQQNYFNKFMALWLTSITTGITEGTFPIQLPVNTKTDGTTVYIGIGTMEEYTTLFNAGNTHIEESRDAGRTLKAALSTLTFESLKQWEDPRVSA